MSEFLFWQLTIDAHDPARLAGFWAQVLGWQPVPPADPDRPWHAHYRRRLGGGSGARPSVVVGVRVTLGPSM